MYVSRKISLVKTDFILIGSELNNFGAMYSNDFCPKEFSTIGVMKFPLAIVL